MSSTVRNHVLAGIVVALPEAYLRRGRRHSGQPGDPKPKPINLAQVRRQIEADEASMIGEREFGVRVTG